MASPWAYFAPHRTLPYETPRANRKQARHSVSEFSVSLHFNPQSSTNVRNYLALFYVPSTTVIVEIAVQEPNQILLMS